VCSQSASSAPRPSSCDAEHRRRLRSADLTDRAWAPSSIVAGLGEALGSSRYAAGYGAGAICGASADHAAVDAQERVVIMFVFSAIPNPVFDVAGTIAGAVKMPVWKFFVSVLLGKMLKDVLIASTGLAGLTLIQHIFE
jgi:membrane protein YqaA with SNARE-associated domain